MKLIKKILILSLLSLLLACPSPSSGGDVAYPSLTQEIYDAIQEVFDSVFDLSETAYGVANDYDNSGKTTIASGWTLEEDTSGYCIVSNGSITYTYYYGDYYRCHYELNSYSTTIDGVNVEISGFNDENPVDDDPENPTYTFSNTFSFTISGWDYSSIQGDYTATYDQSTDELLSSSGTVTVDGSTYDVSNMTDFVDPYLTQAAFDLFEEIATLVFQENTLADDQLVSSGDWVVTDDVSSRNVVNETLGIDYTWYDTVDYIDRSYLILDECDVSGTILTGTLELLDLMNDTTEEDTYTVIGDFTVTNGNVSSINFNYVITDDYYSDEAVEVEGTITIDGETYNAWTLLDFQ